MKLIFNIDSNRNWFYIIGLIAIHLFLYILLKYHLKTWNIEYIVGIILAINIVYGLFIYLLNKGLKLPLWIVLLLGLSLRLLLFTSDPVLSDDVYRYIWDGKVQVEGINPYIYPPNHEHLNHLRDKTIYPDINHKQYPTIYPPLSQLIFYLSFLIGNDSLISLKIIYLLFEIMAIIYLIKLINNIKSLSIYLLCPLIIIEAYGNIHLDIMGMGMVLIIPSLYYLKNKKWYWSILFLALAVQIKYLALVTVPVIFASYLFSLKDRNGWIKAVIHTSLLVIFFFIIQLAFFGLYYKAGYSLFKQLGTYNSGWEFNGSIYSLFKLFMGKEGRNIIIYIYIIFAFWIYFKRKWDSYVKMELVLLFFLLSTHTLYPWYLMWIVPFMVIRVKISEVFLLAIINISYLILIDYISKGMWDEKIEIKILQYLPFYIFLYYDLFKGHFTNNHIELQYNPEIDAK